MQKLSVWRRHPEILWAIERDGLRVTLEIRSWLFFPLLILCWLWYVAAPDVTVAAFVACITALMGLSFWWAWRLAHDLRGERRLRTAVMQVGDELEEQVTLENRSFLPALWAELANETGLPGHSISGVRGVDGNNSASWRVRSICVRRGVFKLGPWQLTSGDPFGVFLVRLQSVRAEEVLVYPPLAALPASYLPHQNAVGDHRPLHQPLRASTVDGMSVRKYLAGDPLRHIHWPTTARLDAPYVKVFQPEAASRVWIIPDLDPLAQVGEGQDTTEETAILLAASLASALLRARLAVGLFAGTGTAGLVMPQRGELHLWTVLERLAPLHSAPGLHLAETLRQLAPLQRPQDLLVIITPSLDPGWLTGLRQLMARRGGSARVYLLDPASFGAGPSAETYVPALAEAGIQARVIRRGEIQAMTAAYGAISRWEFMVSATGRAIRRQTPRMALREEMSDE